MVFIHLLPVVDSCADLQSIVAILVLVHNRVAVDDLFAAQVSPIIGFDWLSVDLVFVKVAASGWSSAHIHRDRHRQNEDIILPVFDLHTVGICQAKPFL